MGDNDFDSDFEIEEQETASEPEPEPEPEDGAKKEIPAETVEITQKSVILPFLKPQENKYWHFTFVNDGDKAKLTSAIENIPGHGLTVEYGIPQNKPDITLKTNDGGEIVGKIHLLLCDRRDANLPDKYYCKVYFYHFTDEKLFQDVKTAVVAFFENFRPSAGSGGASSSDKSKSKSKSTTKKNKRSHRKHRAFSRKTLRRLRRTAKYRLKIE